MSNRIELSVWKKYFDADYIEYDEDAYNDAGILISKKNKFKTARYPYMAVNQMVTKVLSEEPKVTIGKKDVEELQDIDYRKGMASVMGYGQVVVIPYMVDSKLYYDVLPSCDTDFVSDNGELKYLSYMREIAVYDTKYKEWAKEVLVCEHRIEEGNYYYYENNVLINSYSTDVMAPKLINNQNIINTGQPIYATATGIIQDLNINDLHKKIDREISKKEVLIPSNMVEADNRRDEQKGTTKNKIGYVNGSRKYRIMPGVASANQQPIYIDGKFDPQSYGYDKNQNLHMLGIQCGFGAKYFSYDQQSSGMKTATEIYSEQSDLYQSKKMHDKSLKEIIKTLYRGYLIFTQQDINAVDKLEIQFSDNIIQDDNVKKDDALKLYNVEAIDQQTLLEAFGYSESEISTILTNTNMGQKDMTQGS